MKWLAGIRRHLKVDWVGRRSVSRLTHKTLGKPSPLASWASVQAAAPPTPTPQGKKEDGWGYRDTRWKAVSNNLVSEQTSKYLGHSLFS